MARNDYIPRIIDQRIVEDLQLFGALCIEGPKWCGKTWTSEQHAKSTFYVGAADNNFQNKKLSELTPSMVLQGDTPRLLDEWQEVPLLWDAVRHEVDRRGHKGQFILTGSSTPQTKGIMHSGAGRIGRLRMRPMSLFESGDSSGQVSLRDLCDGQMNETIVTEVDLNHISELIVRGGWPGSLQSSMLQARRLTQSYIHSILADDLKKVDNTPRDSRKVELLLRSLARNEASTVSNRVLIKDIQDNDSQSLNENTLKPYLDLLRRLFLTDNVPPFVPNLRSPLRLKKSEKRLLSDPSLAVALLKSSPSALISDLETLGFLFESLCLRDLRIYAESFGAHLYHYQDYRNQEIDAVVELDDGRWAGLEIKLGASQIERAAQNLLKIKNMYMTEEPRLAPSVLAVVCGLGNAAYQRHDGVYVLPITALRP